MVQLILGAQREGSEAHLESQLPQFVEAALINNIQSLTKQIATGKSGVLRAGGLKACLFGNDLYEPVLHVAKGSKIQIAPVSLNESEFQFPDDLRLYIEQDRARLASEEVELFLLRNESRGRGVGFFEAGNFYPDFLLWLVKYGKQPPGLRKTLRSSA